MLGYRTNYDTFQKVELIQTLLHTTMSDVINQCKETWETHKYLKIKEHTPK